MVGQIRNRRSATKAYTAVDSENCSYRAEGLWAHVRTLDADDLVAWLEEAPEEVAIWFARLIRKNHEGNGFLSTAKPYLEQIHHDTRSYLSQYPEWFSPYLTDKVNEAIASPVRIRSDAGTDKRTGSAKRLAYEDYLERMRRIFAECRRVVKDDGIVTIIFTHKSTDAWDALTVGIIESGFRIIATWPIKTEAESSLNIRDRAAARSTILLACRPKVGQTAGSSAWEEAEKKAAAAVRERLPQLEQYDLKPLDIYLASFGPALETISDNWPVRRELANPDRPQDPFTVTPNDALQVAR